MNNQTAVNVVTGYLGSGKTTIISKLIEQLPDASKIVWLKNEYGDVNVDAVLASESNVQVAEIMNGCLCCVLVGRLGNAIDEILQTYSPERIIIESSGTAYPLPIVLELSKNNKVYVDSVVTVIDVLNFAGYHDRSHVASMQTEATDLYLLNKHELATDQQLELVQDLVADVDTHPVFIKTKKGFVDSDLIFDTIFQHNEQVSPDLQVQSDHDHPDEVEVWEWRRNSEIDPMQLDLILKEFKERGLIRAKGIIKYDGSIWFYNWVLGRSTLHPLQKPNNQKVLVLMGQDLKSWQNTLEERLLKL